jgi:hypothetical protein
MALRPPSGWGEREPWRRFATAAAAPAAPAPSKPYIAGLRPRPVPRFFVPPSELRRSPTPEINPLPRWPADDFPLPPGRMPRIPCISFGAPLCSRCRRRLRDACPELRANRRGGAWSVEPRANRPRREVAASRRPWVVVRATVFLPELVTRSPARARPRVIQTASRRSQRASGGAHGGRVVGTVYLPRTREGGRPRTRRSSGPTR